MGHSPPPLKVRVCVRACVCVRAQSCQTLCDPMDCSPPGSSVHGIFQAGILERVATSFSRESSQPRNRTHVSFVSCTNIRILYRCTTWEPAGFPGHPAVKTPRSHWKVHKFDPWSENQDPTCCMVWQKLINKNKKINVAGKVKVAVDFWYHATSDARCCYVVASILDSEVRLMQAQGL